MSPAGFNRSAVRKGPFSTLAIHFLSITGRGRAQTVQDLMSRQKLSAQSCAALLDPDTSDPKPVDCSPSSVGHLALVTAFLAPDT
jgi:hypothetical protein